MKACWCGNTSFEAYSEWYDKCPQCKTLVSKKDINYDENKVVETDFYGKDYWLDKMVKASGKQSVDELIDLYLEERAVYWLKHFFQFKLPGKTNVAEVGCGLGQFSYYLKEVGYQQTAFELSPTICKYISEKMGINIRCGGLDGASQEYDAIVAMDVFEHLIDPKAFLTLADRLLQEDGILFLQMPCYDSNLNYEAMLNEKPRFTEQLKAEEHVYLYSKDSIQAILSEFGFSYISWMDAFFGNDYDMFLAAGRRPLNIFSDEEIDKALCRQPNGYLIRSLIHIWNALARARKEIDVINADREDRLQQILKLTNMIHNMAPNTSK